MKSNINIKKKATTIIFSIALFIIGFGISYYFIIVKNNDSESINNLSAQNNADGNSENNTDNNENNTDDNENNTDNNENNTDDNENNADDNENNTDDNENNTDDNENNTDNNDAEWEKGNLKQLSDYKANISNDIDQITVKVLVIEIDPILTAGTINGISCKGLRASECLGQDYKTALRELINDLEYSSHNIFNIEIVKTDNYNEFARFTKPGTLVNGNTSNAMDQQTWLEIMKKGWWGYWDNAYVKQFGSYSFNYNYLIETHNLIERRNNNEFNEVWLLNVDPVNTFESIMVGKTAYWINGNAIKADCPNFKILNVSISRPDTNFECYGHLTENILGKVFNCSISDTYTANKLRVDSSNYGNLNLFQKFTLNERANSIKNTGLSGPGNIHFSPNSQSDYDWRNYSVAVNSKWQEWLSYPNINNNSSKVRFDAHIYMDADLSGTRSDARLHHRWWFRLFPHINGYTNDGYSNNWWEYIYSMDYATSVANTKNNYYYKVGQTINDLVFVVNYQSLNQRRISIKKYSNNIKIDNTSMFRLNDNNELIAYKSGMAKLTYYKDGKSASTTINIE